MYSPPPTPLQQQQQQHYDYDDDDDKDREDELPSGDVEGATGATLTPDLVAKVKRNNEEGSDEASQGGERFRQLMERASKERAAQQQGGRRPPPQMQMQAPLGSPPAGVVNPLDLPVEEQARLFREFMMLQQKQQTQQYGMTTMQQQQANPYAQPQQQPSYPSNPYAQHQPLQPLSQYPYPQQAMSQQQQRQQQDGPGAASSPQNPNGGSTFLGPGVGYDGRRMGRNKDADVIATTADEYMARLKVDSTTRNYARYAGDETRANTVFHHPSVADVKGPVTNPHLQDQRDRERDMIETVPEEMLLFQEYNSRREEYDGRKNRDKGYSGVSYRERMEQHRASKQGKSQNGKNGNDGRQ